MGKICLKCGTLKQEKEFYTIKDKRVKTGVRLHSYCKACKLDNDRQWRNTHQYECKAYNESRSQ